MSNPSYSEKLRDPRWQKKRLEIMSRDDFTCQKCFSSDETLNIHHCFYEDGKSPWEYPDSSMLTVCESCHEEENSFAARKNILIKAFGSQGFIADDIIDFAASFTSLNPQPRDYIFMSALCHWLKSPDHRQAIIDIYFAELKAKNQTHLGGGPTADGLELSATGRDSCTSGMAERRNEASMEA